MTFLQAGQDRVKSHFGIEFLIDMKNLVKFWKDFIVVFLYSINILQSE